MPFSYKLMLWAHVVSMVGALGVLLAARVGGGDGSTLTRLAARLLGVGFVSGLAVLGLLVHLGGLYTGLIHTVATKFLLLLVAGAGLGIAAKAARTGHPVKAARARSAALVALLLASLLGMLLT